MTQLEYEMRDEVIARYTDAALQKMLGLLAKGRKKRALTVAVEALIFIGQHAATPIKKNT